MRAASQRWSCVFAVLTALALFASAVPDAPALWQESGHDHDHDAARLGAFGGRVHQAVDHDHSDAPHLVAVEPIQRAECAICLVRERSSTPLLLAPQSAQCLDSGTAVALSAPPPASARVLAPKRPRGPPVV